MSDAPGPNPVGDLSSAPVVSVKHSPSGTPATFDPSTIVGSFDELPPNLKNMMLRGIAQNVCRRIKQQSDNLKKIMREGRNQG